MVVTFVLITLGLYRSGFFLSRVIVTFTTSALLSDGFCLNVSDVLAFTLQAVWFLTQR